MTLQDHPVWQQPAVLDTLAALRRIAPLKNFKPSENDPYICIILETESLDASSLCLYLVTSARHQSVSDAELQANLSGDAAKLHNFLMRKVQKRDFNAAYFLDRCDGMLARTCLVEMIHTTNSRIADGRLPVLIDAANSFIQIFEHLRDNQGWDVIPELLISRFAESGFVLGKILNQSPDGQKLQNLITELRDARKALQIKRTADAVQANVSNDLAILKGQKSVKVKMTKPKL